MNATELAGRVGGLFPDVVTARGFGSPSLTAAAATPLLRPSGRLIVSEPPSSDGARWSAELLAANGLELRSVPGTPVVVVQRH